ncbi:hypothetical protein B5S43_12435, partial [Gilliamella apicola]
FERISDDSPDKNSLAMIIFKSRLYFDIKRPPVIGCPTIGGHFIILNKIYFNLVIFYRYINRLASSR